MLRAEPGIKDAAVIPLQAASGGAVLHAYVLPAASAVQSPDLVGLVARCNGRLASHQRLASASWWPDTDLPRTSMLKVRRHLLPQPERGGVVEVGTTLVGG